QRREERIEMTHDVRLAADHEAVAALETEHAAARAAVHVVEPAPGEPGRTVDVVTVVGVPAVHHDVAALEVWDEALERRIDDGRRDHQPDDPGLRELLDEGVQRGRAARTLTYARLHGGCRDVVHHAGVPAADETTHHVRSHATQTDHPDLHVQSPQCRARARASVSRAAATTRSGVKPNFVWSAFSGAEARNGRMPITATSGPTYAAEPNVDACSTATRAVIAGGRTLSRYTSGCRSKSSHDGMLTTRTRTPSAVSCS